MSQTGVDVAAATNDQLIWSTDFNNFKIKKTGTLQITQPASWTTGVSLTATVTHEVTAGFPGFLVYATVPNYGGIYGQENKLVNLPVSLMIPGAGGALTSIYGIAYTDATNLTVDLTNMRTATDTTGKVWNFRYYILQETAATT